MKAFALNVLLVGTLMRASRRDAPGVTSRRRGSQHRGFCYWPGLTVLRMSCART
jgi:hypothetical protein